MSSMETISPEQLASPGKAGAQAPQQAFLHRLPGSLPSPSFLTHLLGSPHFSSCSSEVPAEGSSHHQPHFTDEHIGARDTEVFFPRSSTMFGAAAMIHAHLSCSRAFFHSYALAQASGKSHFHLGLPGTLLHTFACAFVYRVEGSYDWVPWGPPECQLTKETNHSD